MRVKSHINDKLAIDEASERLQQDLQNAEIPESNRFETSVADQTHECTIKTDVKKEKPCPGLK